MHCFREKHNFLSPFGVLDELLQGLATQTPDTLPLLEEN